MALPSSASETSPSHALISNLGFLSGVVVFLQQAWEHASLEHTLTVAASTGLAIYLILALGYAAARGIIAHTPPPNADDAPSPPAAEDDTADGDAGDDDTSENDTAQAEPAA